MLSGEELSQLGEAPGYRVWSSEALPVSEQFAFWNESVHEVFGPMRVARDGTGGFRMEIIQTNIGAMTISSVEADAHHAVRNQKMADLDTTGRVYINVPRSGSLAGRQFSREINPAAGVLGMIAGSTPAMIQATQEFSQFVIGLPAELVAPRLADSAAAGVASGALPGLLTQLTAYLFHHAHEFGLSDAGQVTHQVVDLVVASFGPATAQTSGRPALLLQSAMDFAELNLGVPDLSAELLAAHVNVSRRTLEKLFAERGTTVAHWILERRLDRAKCDLASAGRASRSIEAIAQSWGFMDRTHFSRVFKAQFGVSPAAFRRSVSVPLRHAAPA